MTKGAKLEFDWESGAGEKLYYDLHGEPKGDTSDYFKSFSEATGSRDNGEIRPEFDGPHGWYWENKTRRPITVILHTRGDYKVLGLMH